MAILYHEVPNRNIAIRNFSIAVYLVVSALPPEAPPPPGARRRCDTHTREGYIG
jgi:hypothetical protein